MPFTSGTFSPYTPGNPVVTGTTISSTAFNNTVNDIATGLSTAILKDGTQTVTANIPMGNNKLTGLAQSTATGDALSQGRAITVSAANTASGITASTATATPVTLFAVGADSGLFIVYCWIEDAANYTAEYHLMHDGTNFRLITVQTGAALTLALSGSNVQATQTSGSNQVMSWAYLKIA
jgi:hypothetical protein